MLGDRTFDCQSFFLPSQGSFKRFDNFSTAWRLTFEQTLGIGQDLCQVRGCFQECRCPSAGTDIRPRTCMEILRCQSIGWNSLHFIVSRFSLLSGPLDAWPRYVRQGSNTGLYYSDMAQRKTWYLYRNFEYSTESKPEEKMLEKPACSCSAKWKLGRGSFVQSVCAFLMWFHTEKIRRQICLEPDL